MQVAIEPAPLHGAADVEAAFAAMAKDRSGALIVLVDAITISAMQPIVQDVEALKLPAIYQERTFVERGGLMSYALNYCDHLRRGAAYVDKILKGEKPSKLPVEQPTTFQFVINRNRARNGPCLATDTAGLRRRRDRIKNGAPAQNHGRLPSLRMPSSMRPKWLKLVSMFMQTCMAMK